MRELSIIAIPLAIAAVVLLFGFVGCFFKPERPPSNAGAETKEASDKTCHGATLNGTVSMGGAQTITYNFDYGTTLALGTSTPPDSVAGDVSAHISDLTPGTVYYFDLIGTATFSSGDQSPIDETVGTLSFNTLFPLGFWPLNEGGGSVAFDTSPNLFHGMYHGGVTHAPDLQGAGGKAASFDGTGYVEVPFPVHPELNPPSFRIDALAMASAAPAAGTYGTVISTLDGTSNTGYAIYAGGTSGKWELFLGDGSTQSLQIPAITSTVEVMAAQIVALSASYDANTHEATLTVTGAPTQTSIIAYVPNQAAPLRIASDYTQGDFFSGVLENVHVCPS